MLLRFRGPRNRTLLVAEIFAGVFLLLRQSVNLATLSDASMHSHFNVTTTVTIRIVSALSLCLLFHLLVGYFRFRVIDAPCGALNNAPEFTGTVIGSIMFSSSDSLRWFVASIFALLDRFRKSPIPHRLCFRWQLH